MAGGVRNSNSDSAGMHSHEEELRPCKPVVTFTADANSRQLIRGVLEQVFQRQRRFFVAGGKEQWFVER
jgi:hypothetical protein